MLVAINIERLVFIMSVLLIILILNGQTYWHGVWRMVARLKWLWLSLLVLYGWFLPGSPIFFSETIPLRFIPSYEGLRLGSLRALALLSIVCAVVIVIGSTKREVLIVSIMWLIKPLQMIKINTGQFAARLVLTLEKVTATEAVIKKAMAVKDSKTSLFQRGIDVIADLLLNIEAQASNSSAAVVSLPELESPRILQWLIPLVLFAVLYFL